MTELLAAKEQLLATLTVAPSPADAPVPHPLSLTDWTPLTADERILLRLSVGPIDTPGFTSLRGFMPAGLVLDGAVVPHPRNLYCIDGHFELNGFVVRGHGTAELLPGIPQHLRVLADTHYLLTFRPALPHS